MSGFKPMPTAYLRYDGIDYRNSLPLQGEIEFTCQYISPDEIQVCGHNLHPDNAAHLLRFIEQNEVEGPIPGIWRGIRWFPHEFAGPMPGGVIEEVASWLGYVLGINEWDGSYDEWEH